MSSPKPLFGHSPVAPEPAFVPVPLARRHVRFRCGLRVRRRAVPTDKIAHELPYDLRGRPIQNLTGCKEFIPQLALDPDSHTGVFFHNS